MDIATPPFVFGHDAVVTDQIFATSFDDLVELARMSVTDGRRAILGVAGSPGAGKSTLTESLYEALRDDPPAGLPPREWVAHVPMDGFHLADVELDRLGLRDTKGAPETFDVFGYVDLLRRLRSDDGEEIVYAPAFERELEQPIAGAIGVRPAARLILTEGNYLLVDDGPWARIRPLIDVVWFCSLDDHVRLERLIRRHVRFGKEPGDADAWARGTDERNARRVAGTIGRADLIVGPAVLDTLRPR
jgi:pantothenate kinase